MLQNTKDDLQYAIYRLNQICKNDNLNISFEKTREKVFYRKIPGANQDNNELKGR